MKMLINKINQLKLFKSEDSRFLLGCGLKFSAIFFLACCLIYYVVWLLISINSIYFETIQSGVNTELRQAFIDNSLDVALLKLPYISLFLVFLFFLGIYLGKLLLRPFEVLGKYSSDQVDNKKNEYFPDLFSDYKLLTRFSEFFFRYIDECVKNKALKPNTVPPVYAKIHSPPFERVFFFHFMLLTVIILIVTGFFVTYLTTELSSSLVDVGVKLIGTKSNLVGQFLLNQYAVFESVIYLSMGVMAIGYFILSFHLYSKVSGGIFAFFSTMRSFMKGNYKARVHLIGYSHIRPHGRAFNKYLDLVEKMCTNSDNINENNNEK